MSVVGAAVAGPPVRPGPDQRNDRALAAAVGARDARALAEVYLRHGGSVWALCRRVCRDPHLAQDVCQTVFWELWSSPGRFDPDRGSLRAWLLARSHARAVDAVRAEVARRGREARDACLATGTSDDVELVALGELTAGAVRRALACLAPGERQAITLTYFGGHSYREAAALLGLPEGTVKSRIRAGLGHLRVVLEAEGVTP